MQTTFPGYPGEGIPLEMADYQKCSNKAACKDKYGIIFKSSSNRPQLFSSNNLAVETTMDFVKSGGTKSCLLSPAETWFSDLARRGTIHQRTESTITSSCCTCYPGVSSCLFERKKLLFLMSMTAEGSLRELIWRVRFDLVLSRQPQLCSPWSHLLWRSAGKYVVENKKIVDIFSARKMYSAICNKFQFGAKKVPQRMKIIFYSRLQLQKDKYLAHMFLRLWGRIFNVHTDCLVALYTTHMVMGCFFFFNILTSRISSDLNLCHAVFQWSVMNTVASQFSSCFGSAYASD